MLNYKNLVQAIEDIRLLNKGISFIENDSDEYYISYNELYNKALNTLYHLQTKGIRPGEELVFQLQDNRSFIITFWACILGHIIPVPLAVGNNDEHKLKVLKIWNVLKKPCLITERELFNRIISFSQENNQDDLVENIKFNSILIEEIRDTSDLGKIYDSALSDIVFIQFSSGSTGEPKGVTLTHQNLLTNINAILKGIENKPEDSCLSWMPLTHDMGLIGLHLASLVGGLKQYIMPTSLFIRRPTLWLKKANEHQVTILASPNFGYKYFLDHFKADMAADWDLSHVRLIFNGAEPISADICSEFLNAMSKYKMRKNVIFPVFGLAEASLAVTFPPVGELYITHSLKRDAIAIGENVIFTDDSDTSAKFLDLGYPVQDCSVRICGKNNKVLDENISGLIQIKGNNVTLGYYNNSAATSAAITKDGWLNTGDVGFMKAGRLVVIGRAKDIIFVNGQNYYPHDIEQVAEGVGGLKLGEIVACGIPDERTKTDEICLFVVFKKELEDFVSLAFALKSHINKTMGLEIKNIIRVKRIPKTTSGKVQRYKFADDYRKGIFDDEIRNLNRLINKKTEISHVEMAANATEQQLLRMWKSLLKVENIGVTDNFFELGGNSLKASELLTYIEEQFHIEIPISKIFDILTVRKLSAYIEDMQKNEYLKIPPAGKRDYYPVSSAQRRLFIINQLDNSITYNMPAVIDIKGFLDTDKFTKIFNILLKRHESLRTYFDMIEGEPVQKISDITDLKTKVIPCKKEDIQNKIYEFINPFDLRKPLLLRTTLLRISNERHILLLDMHHIISDGVSGSILMREFVQLYQDQKLSQLKIQYKDYAAWQKEHLETEDISKQREYWLNLFADGVPSLNFPLDYQRPAIQSFEGDTIRFEIEEDLLRKLENLSIKTGTTLFILLLAAYNVLIHKHTGQEDIIVGTPAAGRTKAELNGIIGMFVNTLPLRNYPKSSMTFNSFLDDVKNKSLKALENQDNPFDMLVDALKIKRNMDRNPLFDTMFVLQNMDGLEIQSDNLKFSRYDFENKISKFDFALYTVPMRGRLFFELEFCTKLFRRNSMVRFASHYKNILNTIADDPMILISDINILSKEERDILLYEFNNTQHQYPQEKTICDLFEEQVVKSPAGIAVQIGNSKLTYRELNRKANSLARLLREKGVKPDSIVGIMMEPSLELIVGMLGILKAGGAYLPLDPEYPEARIKYIFNNAGTEILLTIAKHKGKIVKAKTIIALDNDSLFSGDYPNPEKINGPSNLAYVIYTSGSTGTPKGVMLEHRSLNNFLHCICKMFDNNICHEDKYLSLTSITFDVSVCEIFMPLVFGATLVLYDQPRLMDLDHLATTIADKNITFAYIPPTILQDLYLLLRTKNIKLNKMLVGVEPIKDFVLEDFLRLNRNMKILNGYGPTEATICATFYKYESRQVTGKNIPIGRPLANTQIYLLDANHKLVPWGSLGEICISGDGLARGYLNNPVITEEKFVNNPFIAGKKMYKTGDIARLNNEGYLEFVGRVDHQVKIRGYRIELGEIESRLLKHQAVKDAVVLAREDAKGYKYLCAYLVSDSEIIIAHYREYLSKDLPDYMIPAYYIKIPAIPFTTNGKIDRKALPEPETGFNSGVEYVPPRNEIEQELVNVWQEVLEVKQVGIYDNFFDLGGTSLKAIQVSGKLKNFGLNMRHILKNPTIAELSKYAVLFAGQEISLPDVMKKNMEIDYYFNADGERDPLTEIMDCGNLMLYFVLKKQVVNNGKFYDFFAQGFDMSLTEKTTGGIYDMNCSTYHLREDVFEFQHFCNRGMEAMSHIENLLDSGNQIIIDVFCLRNPVFKEFRSFDAPEEKQRRGHIFMLVAHDKEHLFYVEMPDGINAERHVPYIGNRSVAIVKKKDMMPAFEFDVFYSVIYVKMEKLNEESGFKELVEIICKNYVKPPSREGGLVTFYGKEAFQKLIEISNQDFQSLNDRANRYKRTLQDIIDWKFWIQSIRNNLFKVTLDHYEDQKYNKDIKSRVAGLLADSATQWQELRDILTKEYDIERTLDLSIGYRFTEIMEREEEIISLLKMLWIDVDSNKIRKQLVKAK